MNKLQVELKQTIYGHGGSRIWIETDKGRELVADTYMDEPFAVAIRDFAEQWLNSKEEK